MKKGLDFLEGGPYVAEEFAARNLLALKGDQKLDLNRFGIRDSMINRAKVMIKATDIQTEAILEDCGLMENELARVMLITAGRVTLGANAGYETVVESIKKIGQ